MEFTMEDLKIMSADERIKYLRERDGTVDNQVEALVDCYLPPQFVAERARVRRAVGMRVDDHLSVAGGNWGGHALDHLVQGNSGFLPQEAYDRLNAGAASIAGIVYEKLEYLEQARDAYHWANKILTRYGSGQ